MTPRVRASRARAETDDLEHVTLGIEPPTARILLNRPEKKNAMGLAMHRSMTEAVRRLRAREDVKVVVLTGAGDSFCAGMDLRECFFEPFDDPAEFQRRSDLALGWFASFRTLPAITVARVNGWCFGGGVELVGLCDLAVARDDATFGLSEVNFGTLPGGGTLWAVAQHVGRKRAMELMTTGVPFDGSAAAAYGLVNRAVPAAELDTAVEALVAAVAGKSVHALRAIKSAYDRVVRLPFDDGAAWEMAKTHELSYLSGADWVREGVGQFRAGAYRPGLEAYAPRPRGAGADSGKARARSERSSAPAKARRPRKS
jgi:trans-feruloyl-CoA hydratase/vanillin synthase